MIGGVVGRLVGGGILRGRVAARGRVEGGCQVDQE